MFAAILIVSGIWFQLRTKKMRTWRSTLGEVTVSDIEERKHQEGFFSGRYYKPRVCYKFVVDGKTFTGSNFSSQNFTIGFKEEAQELMKNFPPGKNVTVYFDPTEPTKSVLELPNYAAARVFLIVGSAIGVITLLVMIGN